MVDLELLLVVGVVEHVVEVPGDVTRVLDRRNHVEAVLDVHLRDETPVGHPAADEEVLDEVVRQLKVHVSSNNRTQIKAFQRL